MGSRQEPQPQPHSSYQVSGTLALVPSAPYRSLKVPVSVYVCVAGCSSFSEYVVVLRIRERRVEFSVLPFGFLQETKRMVPLGSGKNTLSLFSFFSNEYAPFLLIYKDKEKDRQEALGGLKQVKTRKGRRF